MSSGEIYELHIPMLPTGWVLKPGHRLRLAVSSADFPNLWPTPERARNNIYHGGSHLSRVILPVVPNSSMPPPQFLPPPQLFQLVKGSGAPPILQYVHDEITGVTTIIGHRKGTTVLDDNLGTILSDDEFRCTGSSQNPAQASMMGMHKIAFQREDGLIEVTAESTIRATETAFHILVNLNVSRNGQPFFHKQWTATEPRRLL
jgi:hypothetical protein